MMATTPTPTLPRAPSLLAIGAGVLLFVASRILEDSARTAGLVVTVALALAALVWRARAAGQGSGRGALVTRAALAHGAIAVAATCTALAHLGVVAGDVENIALSVAVLSGVLGVVLSAALELLMAQTRATGVVDEPRVVRATQMSVTLVAGLAALVGAVFALNKNDARLELAYAAPTSPSGATASVIDTAACGLEKQKPEVFLFFERGSTALGEVKDYFDGLAARGARTQTLDQALDPALAKELKVTKNGVVAFRCGEKTDTLSVGLDRDEAQRKVKKLDADVRQKLGKLTRDPVIVYFTVGHGERSYDGSTDRSGRPAGKSLKKLLDAQNATVKKLGLAEGLSDKVPDDAGLVVVFGPERTLLPEEVQALTRYVRGGGALAVFVDPPRPGTDDQDVGASLAPLFAALGVRVLPGEVLNDKEYVKQSNTAADHVFLFSTSFGTHKAVKTLNGARGKVPLLFLSAHAIAKAEASASPKVHLVSRTRPNSFVDANGNRRFDEGAEKRELLDLAAVVEVKGDGEASAEGRALIVGDSDVVSDTLLQSEANAVFAYEAIQWLLRDDASVADGAVTSEDAPIRHTRDEDTAWFYGTTLGGPALVLVGGALFVRRRRGRPSKQGGAA